MYKNCWPKTQKLRHHPPNHVGPSSASGGGIAITQLTISRLRKFWIISLFFRGDHIPKGLSFFFWTSLKLTPGKIEHEILRRNSLLGPKSIPPNQQGYECLYYIWLKIKDVSPWESTNQGKSWYFYHLPDFILYYVEKLPHEDIKAFHKGES